MARQLRFFTDEIAKADVLVAPRLSGEQGMEFGALESKLDDLERELTELNGNSERLNRRFVNISFNSILVKVWCNEVFHSIKKGVLSQLLQFPVPGAMNGRVKGTDNGCGRL